MHRFTGIRYLVRMLKIYDRNYAGIMQKEYCINCKNTKHMHLVCDSNTTLLVFHFRSELFAILDILDQAVYDQGNRIPPSDFGNGQRCLERCIIGGYWRDGRQWALPLGYKYHRSIHYDFPLHHWTYWILVDLLISCSTGTFLYSIGIGNEFQ